MSNSAVVFALPSHLLEILILFCAQGQTYETIIEDTIRASQGDFIEAGISVDYLEALRTVPNSVHLIGLIHIDMAIQAHLFKSRILPMGPIWSSTAHATSQTRPPIPARNIRQRHHPTRPSSSTPVPTATIP